MDADKYLKKVGLGRDDMFFWKQVAWLYNETSPLGWWTLKPRPKEERELAHRTNGVSFLIQAIQMPWRILLQREEWSAQ
ncbi:unnamed protein product [Brassica napus]|uniref:(rape) hypothetical protein n=1 Tax=Brassica napus TaxID=3708 RepID=A0A817B868_BRANA|nr:unnamed protein product [Brassica napus]